METKNFNPETMRGGIDPAQIRVSAFSAKQLGRHQYVLGIDIGGQSIKPELYEVLADGLSAEPVWKLAVNPATKKGRDEHVHQIAEIIMQAQHYAHKLDGDLVTVNVASPGRFRTSESGGHAIGTIKPRTNSNIGKTAHEFDNFPLREGYIAAIKTFDPDLAARMADRMVVANDGNAMLAGMVEYIFKNPASNIQKESIAGKRVALFGIGTGLGHAIADVDPNGSAKFLTDGHASKLLVPVDDEDMAFILEAKKIMNVAGKEEIVIRDNNMVRAEDLLRDPMLKAMCEVESAKDIQWEGSNNNHTRAVNFAGKYMARIIGTIQSGKNSDVGDVGKKPDAPLDGWTEQDKQDAAKTNVYLIGGGVGTSPLGARITEVAKQQLAIDGIMGVQLLQFTGPNQAPRFAATMGLADTGKSFGVGA